MKFNVGSLLLLLVFSTSDPFAGEIFKCVTGDGSVTFSETPCSQSNDEITTVSDLDSNVSTYDSGYSDGYDQYTTNRAISQQYDQGDNADGLRKNKRNADLQPDYIDIPQAPTHPGGRVINSTSGGPVLATDSNTAIDLTTGQPVSGTIIGHDPYKEYREAKKQREITIEAEKYRAKTEKTDANPMLCAEYRMKIDSLQRQIDSNPFTNGSGDLSQQYDKNKAARQKQQELKRFIRGYCS